MPEQACASKSQSETEDSVINLSLLLAGSGFSSFSEKKSIQVHLPYFWRLL